MNTEDAFRRTFGSDVAFFTGETEVVSRLAFPTVEEAVAAFNAEGYIDDAGHITAAEVRPAWVRFGAAPHATDEINEGEECWLIQPDPLTGDEPAFPVWVREWWKAEEAPAE